VITLELSIKDAHATFDELESEVVRVVLRHPNPANIRPVDVPRRVHRVAQIRNLQGILTTQDFDLFPGIYRIDFQENDETGLVEAYRLEVRETMIMVINQPRTIRWWVVNDELVRHSLPFIIGNTQEPRKTVWQHLLDETPD